MGVSLINENLIDVILTNEPELFNDCGVYDPEVSDHALVFGFLREEVKFQQGKIIKFRLFKVLDAKKYKEDHIQAPWLAWRAQHARFLTPQIITIICF